MNAFWEEKLGGNKARDVRVTAALRAQGWRVIRVAEHYLKDQESLATTSARLADQLSALTPGKLP